MFDHAAEIERMVKRHGWEWCRSCDQYHKPGRHPFSADSQQVSIIGIVKVCHTLDHIDCHEPARVIVRTVPDGGGEIGETAYCGKHWAEYCMGTGEE